jgi:hypothetical protein
MVSNDFCFLTGFQSVFPHETISDEFFHRTGCSANFYESNKTAIYQKSQAPENGAAG